MLWRVNLLNNKKLLDELKMSTNENFYAIQNEGLVKDYKKLEDRLNRWRDSYKYLAQKLLDEERINFELKTRLKKYEYFTKRPTIHFWELIEDEEDCAVIGLEATGRTSTRTNEQYIVERNYQLRLEIKKLKEKICLMNDIAKQSAKKAYEIATEED